MDPIELTDQHQASTIAEQENLAKQQESQKQKPTDQGEQKVTYLIQFYYKAILQYIIVLIIFGIFQINEFSNLLIYKTIRDWWGQNFTYAEYKTHFRQSYDSYYDYQNWREEQQKQNCHFYFRGTFYFISTILILLTLAAPIVKKNPRFTKFSKQIFYTQSILIGIFLGGVAAVSQNTWKYPNKICFILWSCILLISNAIMTIVMAKFNKLHYHSQIGKTLVYLILPVNCYLSLRNGELKQAVPIFQIIVIYSLYYFNTLNNSIYSNSKLDQTNIIKISKEWIQEFKQVDDKEDVIAKNKLKNKYIIINKNLAICGIIGIGIVLLLLICWNIHPRIFFYVLFFTGISIIPFFLEMQVFHQNYKQGDEYLAVSSTYLDYFSLLQTILRSI